MNIDVIEKNFTPEMLETIKLETEQFVRGLFSADDYEVNGYLIDTFFVQPFFYSTLLNYYTMYEQRSCISIEDIYQDDAINMSKKDVFFKAFANDLKINISDKSTEEIISEIENRLTISDTALYTKIMSLVKNYKYGQDGTSGIHWNMFRNSPDLMYFARDKFATAVLADNIKSIVEISDVSSQSISLEDITKYQNISIVGGLPSLADIYIQPTVKKDTLSFSADSGEVAVKTIPSRKWKKIDIPEKHAQSIKCSSMPGDYIGFPSRSLTFEITGPLSIDVPVEYYQDDYDREQEIIQDNPALDIKFYGLIPIEISLFVQNKNAITQVGNSIKNKYYVGSKWKSVMTQQDNIFKKNGNAIIAQKAKVWINALCYKEIDIYGDTLSIGSNTIFSWIDFSNTCVRVTSISEANTGYVEQL